MRGALLILGPALLLLGFGALADRGLVASARSVREESARSREEAARLAALSVMQEIQRLEERLAGGDSPQQPSLRRAALAPPGLLGAPAPLFPADVSVQTLRASLGSERVTADGLPEAAVAAVALGDESSKRDVARRLLSGELPVRVGDVRFLARALGATDDPRLDELERRLRAAPPPEALSRPGTFERRLDAAGRLVGWTRQGDGTCRGYEIALRDVVALVNGVVLSASDRAVPVSLPGLPSANAWVSVPPPAPWRVHGPRVGLWLAIAAAVTALVATQRALDGRERTLRRERAFLAGVTHELRSPLAAIRLFGQSLAAGRGDPSEYGELIDVESARLEGLIEQVLATVRADERLSIAPVDPGAIARSVVRLLADRARRRGVELDLRVEPGQGAVSWDGEAVRRALLNLVDNAIRHGPADARVAVTLHRHGDEVWLDVHDEGPGIARRDRKRVFGRFERGTDAVKGTGLGLHLAERTARSHGGRVELSCDDARGCTFSLVLPVEATERAP